MYMYIGFVAQMPYMLSWPEPYIDHQIMLDIVWDCCFHFFVVFTFFFVHIMMSKWLNYFSINLGLSCEKSLIKFKEVNPVFLLSWHYGIFAKSHSLKMLIFWCLYVIAWLLYTYLFFQNVDILSVVCMLKEDK